MGVKSWLWCKPHTDSHPCVVCGQTILFVMLLLEIGGRHTFPQQCVTAALTAVQLLPDLRRASVTTYFYDGKHIPNLQSPAFPPQASLSAAARTISLLQTKDQGKEGASLPVSPPTAVLAPSSLLPHVPSQSPSEGRPQGPLRGQAAGECGENTEQETLKSAACESPSQQLREQSGDWETGLSPTQTSQATQPRSSKPTSPTPEQEPQAAYRCQGPAGGNSSPTFTAAVRWGCRV